LNERENTIKLIDQLNNSINQVQAYNTNQSFD